MLENYYEDDDVCEAGSDPQYQKPECLPGAQNSNLPFWIKRRSREMSTA